MLKGNIPPFANQPKTRCHTTRHLGKSLMNIVNELEGMYFMRSTQHNITICYMYYSINEKSQRNKYSSYYYNRNKAAIYKGVHNVWVRTKSKPCCRVRGFVVFPGFYHHCYFYFFYTCYLVGKENQIKNDTSILQPTRFTYRAKHRKTKSWITNIVSRIHSNIKFKHILLLDMVSKIE